MVYKLGSLFDGSGGFPLAGGLCGIEPVWASEVEPYPIAVTKTRIPGMKHLGDISKINGAEIEPVDVITFGSPCQDLSVAGKRAGLKHEDNGDEETTRSGLFMEAVRIIKEMREATNGKYPTFALWENVPGAFSSNKGEDFRTVLEELIKIAEPSAIMPEVPKTGWPYADCYVGDGWSLAYRTFDAQYWGVPQRRRRIHLIADFRDERAGEVLFEREGVRGYFAQIGEKGERASTNAQGGTGAANREGEGQVVGFDGYNQSCTGEVSKTMTAISSDYHHVPCAIIPFTPAYAQGSTGATNQKGEGSGVGFDAYQHHGWRQSEKLGTLTAGSCNTVRGDTPLVAEPIAVATQQGGAEISENGICPTITAAAGMSGNNQPWICKAESVPYTLKIRSGCEGGGKGALIQENKSATLATNNDQYLFQPIGINGDISGTLDASYYKGCGMRQGIEREVVAIPIHDQATRHSGKRGDKQDGKGNGLGVGKQGDPMNTLTSNDRHAVAYGVDCRNGVENPELNGTLQAKPNGGISYNTNNVVRINYIVRRLTPTECARLQGFGIILDRWGDIEQKDDFTDDEYLFWLEVRNTHAMINGREEKEYTKAQMLTWYNKLHTDGAEYKMWGNGIALPPALYCMQGIVDALNGRTAEAYEVEATDLSDAPQEIKEEIMKNAAELEKKDAEGTPAAVTPIERPEEIKETEPEPSEAPHSDSHVVEQLRGLLEERKKLAKLCPEKIHFAQDVRAVKYAIDMLEAMGL